MTPVRKMFDSIRPAADEKLRRVYETKIKSMWGSRADAQTRKRIRDTIRELRNHNEVEHDVRDTEDT